MKSWALLAGLVVAVVAGASAGPVSASVGGSVMLGASSSKLDGFNDIASDPRREIAGGFGLRFPLGNSLSLEPQLLWLFKGGEGHIDLVSTAPGSTETTSFDFTYAANYLELPVMLRWETALSGLRFHLSGGSSIARLLSSESEFHFDSVTVQNPPPGMAFAQIFEGVGTADALAIKDWDASLIAGAGVAFGGAPLRVTADVRYFHGILNVSEAPVGAYNRTWLLTLGLEW